MDSLFEAVFSPLAQTGKPLSKCGKCLRYMRLITLQPQRLYCPTCEETYSLPQSGTIKLYKELKCPLDNFDLLLFSLGNTEKAQGKSYPLCPYCYNHPPSFDEVKELGDIEEKDSSVVEEDDEERSEDDDSDKEEDDDVDSEEEGKEGGEATSFIHMGCNSCMHPSCKHSLQFTGVCPCPGTLRPKQSHGGRPQRGGRGRRGDRGRGVREGGRIGGREVDRREENDEHEGEDAMMDCSGTLVLDVNSKPNWKLSCNICNTLIRFKSEIHNITPVSSSHSLPNIAADGHCGTCQARLLKFEFHKLKTPLPNKETDYVGCIHCDRFLNQLTDVVAGRTISLIILNQMRHRQAMMLAKNGKKGRRPRGKRFQQDRRKSKKDVLMSFTDF